jgi:hypothetical protein
MSQDSFAVPDADVKDDGYLNTTDVVNRTCLGRPGSAVSPSAFQ